MSTWRQKLFRISAVAALLASHAARAQDLSADALGVVYDLASPQALEKMGAGASHPEARRALDTLRDEKLISAQRVGTASAAGLLPLYGKALLMGSQPTAFATEIGAVRDAHLAGGGEPRTKAINDLYAKAGRPKPDAATMKTLVRQLNEVSSQEATRPVRYTSRKGDRSIEITRTPQTGTVSVEVVQPGADGKPVRTVFQGRETTRRTASGTDLEATIKPDGVCVVADGDEAARNKLTGTWRSSNGHEWSVSGEGGTIEVSERRVTGHVMRYTGTYRLGRLQAYHPFESIEDIGDDLPVGVRTQLVAMKPKYGFTIRLDACSSGTDLKGTWASQHVTYSGMSGQISRVHDPYEVPLLLERGGMKMARGGRLPEEGP